MPSKKRLLQRLRQELQQKKYDRLLRIRRPEQREPLDPDWHIWLLLTGRGWGKTWTGALTLLSWAQSTPGQYACIAHKYEDVRDVMVEGPSGILAMIPDHWFEGGSRKKGYNRSLGEISLANGSKIHMLAADSKDTARGYNLSGAWCDEIVKWRYLESWTEGLIPAVRIGDHPRILVTTTPKRVPLVRMLLARAVNGDATVRLTRGSTFDNAANLSSVVLAELRRQYDGTTIGRQELYAEMIEDVDGALWKSTLLDKHRVDIVGRDALIKVVVAVDPAVTHTELSDETGIIVCGKDALGHGFVLDDVSGRYSPGEWATKVLEMFDKWDAQYVVVEVNQGGDLVGNTIRNIRPNTPVHDVRAAKSKRVRAEPIAALAEQGKIHLVGRLPELEDQLTTWVPTESNESPDRLDALVWGFTDLFDNSKINDYMSQLAPPCPRCTIPVKAGAPVCNNCGFQFGQAGAA